MAYRETVRAWTEAGEHKMRWARAGHIVVMLIKTLLVAKKAHLGHFFILKNRYNKKYQYVRSAKALYR